MTELQLSLGLRAGWTARLLVRASRGQDLFLYYRRLFCPDRRVGSVDRSFLSFRNQLCLPELLDGGGTYYVCRDPLDAIRVESRARPS